ncbi:MAG TPA: hypothetical protein VK745_28030, partial [Polyangiaceae bacterium]|nr:hypothetical protein [Polyangiaceae bacterium]
PGILECVGTCPGNRPACDTTTGMCVECLSDTDCVGTGKPGCLVSTHKCEDCSKTSQCPAGKTCDVTKGQCQ